MKDRRGFTVIEIMIVMAIIGIVAVIATTNFSSWQNHYSAVGFQREFLSSFNQARTRTMASNLQYRLLIDNSAGTAVTLQRGTLGTGTPSTGWTNVGESIVGRRGARIARVDNCAAVTGPPFALLFNPDGEILVQDNNVVSPLTQADIRISATSATDQATIRVYGWTSKARLINGWN